MIESAQTMMKRDFAGAGILIDKHLLQLRQNQLYLSPSYFPGWNNKQDKTIKIRNMKMKCQMDYEQWRVKQVELIL